MKTDKELLAARHTKEITGMVDCHSLEKHVCCVFRIVMMTCGAVAFVFFINVDSHLATNNKTLRDDTHQSETLASF